MAIITTEGLNDRARKNGGITGSDPFIDFILGSGTVAEAVGIKTTDMSILTTGGSSRMTVVSSDITLEAGSVCQWVKAYTFTTDLSIAQFACAHASSIDNELLVYHKFASAKSVVDTDTATITLRVTET
jgi:hypothetical protein